jgi:hypothetical protein
MDRPLIFYRLFKMYRKHGYTVLNATTKAWSQI